MKVKERALSGAAGGAGATLFLSGLRQALSMAGIVYETAPMQVVDRLQEISSIRDRPLLRRVATLAAHLGYGVGAGTVLGLMRREREGPGTELSVGVALGILLWGMGWAGWLPILGADRAPWGYRTPRVLLPIFDHAAFGAAWATIFYILSRKDAGDA